MLAPRVKTMLENATCSRLRGKVLLSVVVVVLLFKCCSSQDEKCGKRLSKRKCGGRHYFLTPQLARAAELPVGSIVCRVHWDEIRRQNNRCSVPRENHSRALHKNGIPSRLYAVLDAVGKAGNAPYRPGTRWCNKCAENVDQEEKFTTHAEYKPKEARTSKQKVSYMSLLMIIDTVGAQVNGIWKH